jgi:hypothetical protein
MSYSGIALRSQVKLHPTEMKIPGSNEHLVGRNNEINANDKAQLLRNINALFVSMASGEVMQGNEAVAAERNTARKERREALTAAMADRNGRSFQDLGTAIGAEIYETANRDGFMRRLFQKADVQQGTIPRIRFAYKTQYAVAAASATTVAPLNARSKFLLPPEFYIEDNLLIEEREISQSSGDVLEEKLLEAQEAIMVREDALWKAIVNKLVGAANQLVTIVGSFSPQALQAMRNQIQAWGLPADTLLFANDIWNDILTNSQFTQFYDPVSQYEIVQTGVIGRVLGLTLISDAYRVPQLRVFNQGEMYLVSRPEYHGAYTDRGPVTAQEINAAANGQGMPARGWYLWEQMSMVSPNARSIVRATRQ